MTDSSERGTAGPTNEVALSNGRLLAWSALIAATTLLNFATAVFVEVPEDRIYRYQTAVTTLLQFGTLLAVVLLIARPGGLRDVLALRRPSSWKRAAAIGPLVAVGSLVVLIVLDPLLGAGEAQRLAAGWDPARSSAFAVNAALIILVGPVVEELTFRGLGFTLLVRFGRGWAIALTAASFALSHGLIALLPASAIFGAGLAYLRSRTCSVYPGIVLHVVFNALGVAGSTLR